MQVNRRFRARSSTVVFIRALLVLAAVLALPGGRAAAAQEPTGPPAAFIPGSSCVTSVADTVEARRVRVLQADGLDANNYGGERVAAEAPWAPGRVADLTPYGTGYAVLDGLAGELVRVSGDLTTWDVWAEEGPGPGELTQPRALATSGPGSNELLVLQGDPPAAHRFDGRGRFVDTFRLNSNPNDLGVTSDGRVWLVHDVWGLHLRPRRGTEAPVLTSTDENGRQTREHWSATADSLDAARYNLGYVRVRVATGGRFAAVYFPTSGIIELFDDGGHVRTLETCMPEELADAYRRQLDETTSADISPGRPPVAEYSVDLLTDVRVGENGEVWALVGVRTEDGFFHIDRFDASGRNIGSILLSLDAPFELQGIRLGLDPEREVVGFDPMAGHLFVYELSGS